MAQAQTPDKIGERCVELTDSCSEHFLSITSRIQFISFAVCFPDLNSVLITKCLQQECDSS
jgi:hypothetical protein